MISAPTAMVRWLKIYMWPVWFLALGTQAKSFRDNPVIGSRLLNFMGLHVLRILLAQASAHFRWMLLSPLMPKPYRRAYQRDGFVLIENFLSAEEVSALRLEVGAYTGTIRQMTQGDTATQRILLDDQHSMPRAYQISTSRRLRNYLAYGGAKWSHSIMHVQRIHNGCRTAASDPQKVMHSDTFHPTMKAWLFLEDVTEAKGPFTYVRGSNRLRWKRLKWEYWRSVNHRDLSENLSKKGSLRARPEDLAEMGLPAPEGITAKAGTLVIANTNGFHGRGQAAPDASRLELWAYSRHNPFSPWPGLPLDWVVNTKYRIMRSYWQHEAEKAAKLGKKGGWRDLPAEGMTAPYRAETPNASMPNANMPKAGQSVTDKQAS